MDKLRSGRQHLRQLLITCPPLRLAPSILHVRLLYHVLHPDPLDLGAPDSDHRIGTLVRPPLLPRKLGELFCLLLDEVHRLEGQPDRTYPIDGGRDVPLKRMAEGDHTGVEQYTAFLFEHLCYHVSCIN